MMDVFEFHSVKQRENFNILFLVKNNIVPKYMYDKITYNRHATTWIFRNAADVRLATYKKTYTQYLLNVIWRAKTF
jgi:hypothetical protein